MSVASHFSTEILVEFNKIYNDYEKCKQLCERVDISDNNTLIYLYLHLCKLIKDKEEIVFYTNKANKIYKNNFSNKFTILNEFDWIDLELYKYNLRELFNYDVYMLSDNAELFTGRCLFKPDDILFYRYKIVKQIGKGTFSNVYKCFDFKRNQHIAIKAIRNDTKFKKSGLKEVNILKQLSHTSICNYVKFFEVEQHYFIVFNLLQCNIYSYLKTNKFTPFKPNIVKQFTKQMLEVLVYIKEIDVIHCDIKPENILIESIDDDNITVKLADFGSAMKKNKKFTGYIVSRYYRAPEIVLEQSECCDYPIDMWSVSTIIYELLTGDPLFSSKTQKNLIYDIFKELGFPPDTFLFNCKKRKLLESQLLYISQPITLYNKLSSIQDIDIESYNYLKHSLQWKKENRLTCEQGLHHKFILN